MGSPTAVVETVIAHRIRNARNFGEFCGILGYGYEEHTVTTDDGYVLMLHRLVPLNERQNLSWKSKSKQPVVYFQHGLLTNSELFMLVTHPDKCLPIVLASKGYDVWLGNNR